MLAEKEMEILDNSEVKNITSSSQQPLNNSAITLAENTTCTDDSLSSGSSSSWKSRSDISFPCDLLHLKRPQVKRSSLERKERHASNRLRVHRQISSLVAVVDEEDKGETDKSEKGMQQKKRVFRHLQLIFDDGEKSEEQGMIMRCKSADRVERSSRFEISSGIYNGHNIIESADENEEDSSNPMKISGLLESILDRNEVKLDVNNQQKRMVSTISDVINEECEIENIQNDDLKAASISTSAFQVQCNSPKYRLKVDEIDDEDFKKNTIKKAVFIQEDHPVIIEEAEPENDRLYDILEKVRTKIEKQETFLKKIAMQNVEGSEEGGEFFQSRRERFEEITEIENDCDEKNSSSEDDLEHQHEVDHICNNMNS